MAGRFVWACLAAGALMSSGCRMCPQPAEDYAYAAYGGLIQRADRIGGRVGSAFAPAEAAPAHPFDPGIPVEGPPLAPPPYAAQHAEAPPGSGESAPAASTAFDPGDILSTLE